MKALSSFAFSVSSAMIWVNAALAPFGPSRRYPAMIASSYVCRICRCPEVYLLLGGRSNL